MQAVILHQGGVEWFCAVPAAGVETTQDIATILVLFSVSMGPGSVTLGIKFVALPPGVVLSFDQEPPEPGWIGFLDDQCDWPSAASLFLNMPAEWTDEVLQDQDIENLMKWPTTSPTRRSRHCLLYTSPSPRDKRQSRMPSSA